MVKDPKNGGSLSCGTLGQITKHKEHRYQDRMAKEVLWLKDGREPGWLEPGEQEVREG